jgi:hypothetical protein
MSKIIKLSGRETPDDVLKYAATGHLMHLSASAMEIILKSVAAKEITTESAQLLADALECEFVVYEDFKAGAIAEALFVLSSPEINGLVSPERCIELVKNLLTHPAKLD